MTRNHLFENNSVWVRSIKDEDPEFLKQLSK